jgi:hypothetical protein
VYSIRCISIGGGAILVITVVQRPDNGRLANDWLLLANEGAVVSSGNAQAQRPASVMDEM